MIETLGLNSVVVTSLIKNSGKIEKYLSPEYIEKLGLNEENIEFLNNVIVSKKEENKNNTTSEDNDDELRDVLNNIQTNMFDN